MKTRMLCLTLLTLWVAENAFGADSEPATSAKPGASAEASEDSSADTAPDKGTEGVFLPSEEISEDFAVSFPVDI